MAEETTEQDKTTPPDDVPLPAEAAATEAADGGSAEARRGTRIHARGGRADG